jgi:adenylate cyclase
MTAERPGPGHHDTADYEAAGLYDPTDAAADRRLELLEYLAGEGVTLDEMIEACEAGRLNAAAGDALLRTHQPRLTVDELAELTGVAPEMILGAWSALGFPEPPPGARVWWPSDAAIFAAMAGGTELFGLEKIEQFTRVIGTSMARLADAVIAMFLAEIQAPIEAGQEPPVALARANTAAVQALDTLPAVFEAAFRHHVAHGSRGGTSGGRTSDLALGFADQVGSTALARRLDPAGTAALASSFESGAHRAVTQHGGRLIKAIGDGVLFTAPDAPTAAGIADALLRWTDGDPGLPPLRIGLHAGRVVWQDGDVYGPAVNLAARVTEVAEPGQVLTTRAFAEALGTGAGGLRPLGTRDLKGFDEPVEVLGLTASGAR